MLWLCPLPCPTQLDGLGGWDRVGSPLRHFSCLMQGLLVYMGEVFGAPSKCVQTRGCWLCVLFPGAGPQLLSELMEVSGTQATKAWIPQPLPLSLEVPPLPWVPSILLTWALWGLHQAPNFGAAMLAAEIRCA